MSRGPHIQDLLAVRRVDTGSNDNNTFQYVGVRLLWHPEDTRGLYGGCLVAQSLVAAHTSIPKDYLCHSMHCYFVLAGKGELPISYDVRITRKGKTFITAHVDATQESRLIFTTIASFAREDTTTEDKKVLDFTTPLPLSRPTLPDALELEEKYTALSRSPPPFLAHGTLAAPASTLPHSRVKKIWLKTHRSPSEEYSVHTQMAALAMMTDCYYITAIAQLYHLPMRRFVPLWCANYETQDSMKDTPGLSEVAMMVSLDHVIYFHHPRQIRTEEWIYAEMRPDWAGEERGLISQKIWDQDGNLLITSIQEGMIRLSQPSPPKL